MNLDQLTMIYLLSWLRDRLHSIVGRDADHLIPKETKHSSQKWSEVYHQFRHKSLLRATKPLSSPTTGSFRYRRIPYGLRVGIWIMPCAKIVEKTQQAPSASVRDSATSCDGSLIVRWYRVNH